MAEAKKRRGRPKGSKNRVKGEALSAEELKSLAEDGRSANVSPNDGLRRFSAAELRAAEEELFGSSPGSYEQRLRAGLVGDAPDEASELGFLSGARALGGGRFALEGAGIRDLGLDVRGRDADKRLRVLEAHTQNLISRMERQDMFNELFKNHIESIVEAIGQIRVRTASAKGSINGEGIDFEL